MMFSKKMFPTIMPDETCNDRSPLSDDEAAFITSNLRGIRQATIRFLGDDHDLERSVISTCLILEDSVKTERLQGMAPYPHRRFSFRYVGNTAIVTVSPSGTLTG